MDWRLPPISEFPPEYDPMHRGFEPVRSFPGSISTPSRASVPSGTANPEELSNEQIQEIYKYMYPINPDNNDFTVIGVHTGGPSRTSKKYLKDIYRYFNIPLLCHSCGKTLESVEENICIGDHQPPTSLKELIDFPEKLEKGEMGIKGRIVKKITNKPRLTVYNFTYKIPVISDNGHDSQTIYRVLKIQTNNPKIVPQNAESKVSCLYGTEGASQYLYPHCEECSNRQGKILQGRW